MIRQALKTWLGVEERDQSLTDEVVKAVLAAAGQDTTPAEIRALAVVEACAGIWASGFSAAKPSAGDAMITPAVLARLGRELLLRGQALWIIEVQDGALELVPASIEHVTGSAAPSTWRYTVKTEIPTRDGSSAITRSLSADQVVHCRINANPAWQGNSPLGSAGLTAKLAANLERSIGYEAGTVAGYVLPMPTDGQDDSIDELKQEIGRLRGGLTFVETTASGYGLGPANAPPGDWKVQRLGPNVPDGNVELRQQVERSIVRACGLPEELLFPSGAATAREGMRRWLRTSLAPVARLAAQEFRSKLDLAELEFDFSALRATDVAGPARAYSSLVQAGMSEQDALVASGLELLS